MKHLLSVVVSVAAVVGFATTTSDLEAEDAALRARDPMAMSASELATAFPAEFAYLRDTFALSGPATAEALRLTWSAGSARQWAMAYVPGYAGTWVDYQKAAVYVGVAGGEYATQAARRGITLGLRSVGVAPTVVTMPRTYEALATAAHVLHDAADPNDAGVVQVSIDERNSALTLDGMTLRTAEGTSQVARLLRTEGYPSVRFNETTLEQASDVHGGWDGRQSVGCTVAFTVVSPSNSRAVLTAGHCVDNAAKVSGLTLSVAQYQRSFWPWLGGAADSGYDRQLHVLPAGVPTVGHLAVPNVAISGTFLPAVGSVICRYGAASVAKGQATSFCSTVTGYGYDGFVGMATGCISGDSGGPSWVMGKAVGIAAVTTDPTWPVDSSSTCWEAPVKDQLNGTGYYVQDVTYGYGSDFRSIGLFHPVGPTRILDTRGKGRVVGETNVPLDKVLAYADLGSVVLSVTIVPRGAAGTATVYAGDNGFVPVITNVSYNSSGPESNLVISPVNRYTKSVKVFTNQSVDLVVDVLGYFSDTSGMLGAGNAVRVIPLTGTRIYDSRTIGILASGTSRDIQVRGVAGVPSTATAVVANLTVTNATGTGYLTAHAGGTGVPGTSNLNFTAGQTKARLAIVPLDAQGRMRITTGGASRENVIVDVQGYLEPANTSNAGRTFSTDGGSSRMVDTTLTGVPMTNGATVCIDMYAGRTDAGSGLPRDGLRGVWLSVTASAATANGYVVTAARGQTPGTSSLNFTPGNTRTNTVFVAVPSSSDGRICLTVYGGTTHLTVDVVAMTTA